MSILEEKVLVKNEEFECLPHRVTCDDPRGESISQKKLYDSEECPEIVKTLMDKGFYVQGSRSKIPAKHLGDADWDLTFPIDSKITKKEMQELGFINVANGTNNSEDICFEGEYFAAIDVNFKSFYKHNTLNVTVHERQNEKLFRHIWEAISPSAFELFVWKRSVVNAGMSADQIRNRRYIFMQTMYAAFLGMDHYSDWTIPPE